MSALLGVAGLLLAPKPVMADCPCMVMNGVSNALVKVVNEAADQVVINGMKEFITGSVHKGTLPAAAGTAASATDAAKTLGAKAQQSAVETAAVQGQASEIADVAAEVTAAQTPSDALVVQASALVGLPKAARNVEHARIALGNFDTDYHVGVAGDGQPKVGGPDGAASVEDWLLNRVYPSCHINSYGGTMRELCKNDGSAPDVTDYSQFIDQRSTLFLLNPDGQPLDPDPEANAPNNDLGRVLTFKRLVVSVPPLSRADSTLVQAGNFRDAYLNMRAAAAKRSVIENSLNTIIAMKAEGAAESRAQVAGAIERAGLEVPESLGPKPSYDAQMEVLTRTLYQSQDFFEGVINHEADLQRQLIFMNGVQLMQDRDTAKSAKRIEMLLSQLLEDELRNYKNIILKQ